MVLNHYLNKNPLMLVSETRIDIDRHYRHCFPVALANSSDIPKQIFLCIIANDKKVRQIY